MGSPPRVRGTAAFADEPPGRDGITPACAGNRGVPGFSPQRSADHPRVCGEQSYAITAKAVGRGSPPRVRGTGSPEPACTGTPRITPACAGNRFGMMGDLTVTLDHPRVCGEQCFSYPHCSSSAGSPPRVRGTGTPPAAPWEAWRITPACAGSSS